MKIYHYDPETGEYIKEGMADNNPRNPGKPLVPAFATTVKPPPEENGYNRFFQNGEWCLVEDPPPNDMGQPEELRSPDEERVAKVNRALLDIRSVRTIREWIAGDDNVKAAAYERLRGYEEEAKKERGKLGTVVVQEKG